MLGVWYQSPITLIGTALVMGDPSKAAAGKRGVRACVGGARHRSYSAIIGNAWNGYRRIAGSLSVERAVRKQHPRVFPVAACRGVRYCEVVARRGVHYCMV